jgi:hypothetical protein
LPLPQSKAHLDLSSIGIDCSLPPLVTHHLNEQSVASDEPQFNPFQANQQSPTTIFRIDKNSNQQALSVPSIRYLDFVQSDSILSLKKSKPLTINIKKDALWKPLLRLFRRFVKKICQQQTSSGQSNSKGLPSD